MIQTCGLAQSAVSQHLAKLKQAKLVQTQKNGTEILYSLTSNEIVKICQKLQALQKEVV